MMNNTKNTQRKTIILLVLLLTSTLFYGQRRRMDQDKIKALKVAYITEKVDLSSKEAEAFWPIYNTYEKDLSVLRQKERSLLHDKMKAPEILSEKEAKSVLKQQLSLKEEKYKIERVFIAKISKVISAKKTIILLQAEKGFHRQLIRQYRSKRRKH
ncbi:MAG: hypothetical protein V3U92_16780 [Cellulophaga sp.]